MVDYQLPKTEFSSNLEKSVYELRDACSDKAAWIGYFSTLKYTAEEQETIAAYKTDLDSYVKETLALWITGEKELTDATWEEYLNQCKKLHLDDLTAVYKKAINRVYGVE